MMHILLQYVQQLVRALVSAFTTVLLLLCRRRAVSLHLFVPCLRCVLLQSFLLQHKSEEGIQRFGKK